VTTPPTQTLLIYFSRAGENYWYGGRRSLEVGNTAVLAGMISDQIACDVHRIEAADPYPDGYEATVARNSREQNGDARPGVSGTLPDITGYTTLLVASPIWNVRPPMIMSTVLEALPIADKRLLPVTTHAMSGLGRSVEVYRQLAPRASLGEGLAVRGEEVAGAGEQVEQWLRQVGLS